MPECVRNASCEFQKHQLNALNEISLAQTYGIWSFHRYAKTIYELLVDFRIFGFVFCVFVVVV